MKGSDPEISMDSLFDLAMNRKWDEVVEVYRNHSWAHTAKITKSEETALHVAVSSYHAEGISCYECTIKEMECRIKEMISCCSQDSLFEILSMRNDKGNTPLHLAAAVGWADICEFIASKNSDLIKLRNLKSETPLFIAAYHGKLQTFLCLHDIYTKDRESDESLCRREDGNTILHSAISGEYFELGYQIISYYPKLVNSVNVKGETPLHVLANKPNVFISSSHLGFYDSIIYRCVFVNELKKQNYALHKNNAYGPKSGINYPKNYRTCLDIVQFLGRPIWKSVTASFDGCPTNPTDEENQHKAKDAKEKSRDLGSFPANYMTCISLFKFAMTVILTVLGVGFARIRKILDKKQKHMHAIQIMNEMIELESSYKYDNDGQKPVQIFERQCSERIAIPDTPPRVDSPDKESNIMTTSSDEDQSNDKKEKDQNKSVKDTPILTAAKMGIPEMVEKILSRCPVAIQDLDSHGKNVLLLAAENRQVSVFDYLLKIKLPEYIFHQVDDHGNNILHLAAMLEEPHPWRIPGAALQMQWELKWYKHVKRSIPARSFAQNNKNGKTPRKIFSTTHESLVKEGTKWLIKTSESCSVIAALIATVAFATSATVPGGLDQKTGHPILENHTAFDVFSISSLVALCLSVTALVFFLAIITSRCEERDFKRNLPRKLLMGLTALFASIAGMLVSFCAGHTFILKEKLRLATTPIYAIATIPVMFFAVVQLPLYFDLLRAASIKVPLRSYKVFYH